MKLLILAIALVCFSELAVAAEVDHTKKVGEAIDCVLDNWQKSYDALKKIHDNLGKCPVDAEFAESIQKVKDSIKAYLQAVQDFYSSPPLVKYRAFLVILSTLEDVYTTINAIKDDEAVSTSAQAAVACFKEQVKTVTEPLKKIKKCRDLIH